MHFAERGRVVLLTHRAANPTLSTGMFRAFEKDFGASLQDLGFMYLLQCLVASIALPVWGSLGDRMSRKVLLQIGCFSWGCFTICCSVATNFMMFTMFRTFAAMFMSLVSPIAQSVVADLAPGERRGRLFGKIGFIAMLGAFAGQFTSTAISEKTYGSMRGWRLCLLVVGLMSCVFPAFVQILMAEPRRERNAPRRSLIDWESLRSNTFWLLVGQGIFGSIPWRAFLMFSVLFFELIGYTPMQVAILGACGMLANAVGHLIAGYIGDYFHSVIPYSGRLYAAQISIASGCALMAIILVALPKEKPDHILLFGVFIGTFNLMATWPSNATNRPLIADIVPPQTRASCYSIFAALENIPSSFSGYIAAFIASEGFGYHKQRNVDNLTDADRDRNVMALSRALLLITLVPWALSFSIYAIMHYTYKYDVNRTVKRLRNQGIVYGPNSDDEDEEQLERIKLLAEGKRN